MNIHRQKYKKKMPASNEGFGVRRGVVSWDTSQDFGSSPPVRTFVKPRPNAKPQTRCVQADDGSVENVDISERK